MAALMVTACRYGSPIVTACRYGNAMAALMVTVYRYGNPVNGSPKVTTYIYIYGNAMAAL